MTTHIDGHVIQNSITKYFVDTVKTLIDKGEIVSQDELAQELKYNKTSLSSVMNGRRNVPSDVYKRFSDRYGTDRTTHINDAIRQSIKNQITIIAAQRVLLMALAELLAQKRNQSTTTVLSELEAAVKAQTGIVIDLL
jgi:hypothetical protein